jgi:hypothetical protein
MFLNNVREVNSLAALGCLAARLQTSRTYYSISIIKIQSLKNKRTKQQQQQQKKKKKKKQQQHLNYVSIQYIAKLDAVIILFWSVKCVWPFPCNVYDRIR